MHKGSRLSAGFLHRGLLLALAVAVMTVPAWGQQKKRLGKQDIRTRYMYYTMAAGLSKVTGDVGDYWKIGANVGLETYFNLTPNLLTGLRVGYCGWHPDAGDVEHGYPESVTIRGGSITGRSNMFEVLGGLRLVPAQSHKRTFSYVLHGGGGLYVNTTTVKDSVSDDYQGRKSQWAQAGVNVGLGFRFYMGNDVLLEVLPVYHVIFAEVQPSFYFNAIDPKSYVAINIGFVIVRQSSF